MVYTQDGSVLHLCTKFEANYSILSKVIKGSHKFGNLFTWFSTGRTLIAYGHDHAHLCVVYGLYAGGVRHPSLMVCTLHAGGIRPRCPHQKLKRIVQFVQKLLRGS